MTEVEDIKKLRDEIARYLPSEIICNDAFLVSGMELDELKDKYNIAVYSLDAWYFDDDNCKQILMKHFKVNSLKGLGLDEFPAGMIASGALLQYLYFLFQ